MGLFYFLTGNKEEEPRWRQLPQRYVKLNPKGIQARLLPENVNTILFDTAPNEALSGEFLGALKLHGDVLHPISVSGYEKPVFSHDGQEVQIVFFGINSDSPPQAMFLLRQQLIDKSNGRYIKTAADYANASNNGDKIARTNYFTCDWYTCLPGHPTVFLHLSELKELDLIFGLTQEGQSFWRGSGDPMMQTAAYPRAQEAEELPDGTILWTPKTHLTDYNIRCIVDVPGHICLDSVKEVLRAVNKHLEEKNHNGKVELIRADEATGELVLQMESKDPRTGGCTNCNKRQGTADLLNDIFVKGNGIPSKLAGRIKKLTTVRPDGVKDDGSHDPNPLVQVKLASMASMGSKVVGG